MINDIPADRTKEVKGDPKLQVLTWFPLNWDFVNLNHEFVPFKFSTPLVENIHAPSLPEQLRCGPATAPDQNLRRLSTMASGKAWENGL